MAVCPKCGISFSYAETHVCEGTDRSKVWLIAAVGVGALAGAPFGRLFGNYIIGLACNRPDAGNLCGLFASLMVPVLVVAGAVVGASITAFALTIVLTRRS